MALIYLGMALIVMVTNLSILPEMFKLIITDAFTGQAAAGGALGIIISNGFKRGLFSNESGMGTAPNTAASATTSHPVSQGLIQALGVFIDTIVICNATAFIILISGVPIEGDNEILITQNALNATLGGASSLLLTVSIVFFAFSTILGIYYYSQSNYEFIFKGTSGLNVYKTFIVVAVFVGSIVGSTLVWTLGDLSTGLMALVNLCAIVPLYKYVHILLADYRKQLKDGKEQPLFNSNEFEEFKHLDVWQD